MEPLPFGTAAQVVLYSWYEVKHKENSTRHAKEEERTPD